MWDNTAYNIPELAENQTLVLDFATMAGIYNGTIEYWDDEAIRNLNSAEVRAALPHQPIIVLIFTAPNAITTLVAAALNQGVPGFQVPVSLPHERKTKQTQMNDNNQTNTGTGKRNGFPRHGQQSKQNQALWLDARPTQGQSILIRLLAVL